MKLNVQGLEALHQREGLRLKPYLDTQGIPTIALGNTFYQDGKKVTMQDKPLTMEQATRLADTIIAKFEKVVNEAVKTKLTQNQFNSLVSFTYNIGPAGFKSSTVLKLVNKNPNDPKIKDAFMMWTKNKELIGRRASEVNQYFK